MVAKKSTLKGIIFILVLIVIAMGYSMYTTSIKNKKETYVSSSSDTTSVENNTEESNESSSSQTSTPKVMEDGVIEEKVMTVSEMEQCEKDFSAELKKNKTEYEKGRILVGFTKDTSFSKAKSVAARYDLVPVLAGVDESSYSLTHLLTINVPTGREPHFVCVFKQDASVRYSNVSSYLFLHD